MNIADGAASAFREEVSGAKTVLVGSHLNPDGDALGSALAVGMYLDSLGKYCEVVSHHEAPKNLRFLPQVDRITQSASLEEYDLGIVLDLDSLERLGKMEPFFARCRRLVVIDHHIPHAAPGDLRIVDTSAAATSLILTHLLVELGAEITPDIATCLLTGIVTDTGSFRFRNTTPDSLSLSAYLLEHGGDITRVSEEVFQTKPLCAVKLLGHTLETMRLACNNQIAWSALSVEDFRESESADEDTEGFVNELLFIESVQVAALLREAKPGRVRVSIRSRKDIDVAEVARHFGGGGHRNAAGCTLEMPLPEAERQLVEKLKTCLASC